MNRLPLLLLLPLLLTACPPPPIPCPPNCPPPASATPTNPPTAPTPRPTATPSPTVRPTAVPPVQVQQLTRGRAVVEVDLRGFVARPDLDKYAAATLLWEASPIWPKKPSSPALELQIAGIGPELCAGPGRCGKTSLGLVVRWSANLSAYKQDPDPCGIGINAGARLPIGNDPLFDLVVEWSPGLVKVTTPTGASWSASVAVSGPGFGVFVPGVPNPRTGIGWERSDWILQEHGGSAYLLEWNGDLAVPSVAPCQ